MTGIWLAANAPERIERLALCTTSAHVPPAENWLERAAVVRARGVGAVADAVVARWFTAAFAERDPATVARLRELLIATPAEGYAACCEAIAALDLRDDLPTIQAPTLVIASAEDSATPPEHGRRIADAVPDARLVVLSEAAHLANVEQPEAVVAALVAHLVAEVAR